MSKKIWGGRFKKEMHTQLKKFSYSLLTDYELFESELEVNIAYVQTLAKIKLINPAEKSKLLRGIEKLKKDWDPLEVCFLFDRYEDIHAFIQSELEKSVGKTAKKLHTGRSRNDLVVTSTRLFLSKKVRQTIMELSETQRSLVGLAKKAKELVIPGLTHLRKAQPVYLAHHLLAYVEMLEEDKCRLRDSLKRIEVLALGSAALAGSSLPIDQEFLKEKLGFTSIASNSMAVTSDRGFAAEVLSVFSILWMHLSRLSEDFILWNSEYVDFVELDDAFATGSSLMPQKKNPDVFELTRGRAGVIFGSLMSLLTLQKGLPLAYNRDLQEDKPGLFDALRKTSEVLQTLSLALKSISFKPDAVVVSLIDDTLFATDLLEYLVRKGVAFSEGHEAIGKLIVYAMSGKKPLRGLELKEYRKFSKSFAADVYELFDVQRSVSAKKTVGSTNPKRVQNEIRKWQKQLGS